MTDLQRVRRARARRRSASAPTPTTRCRIRSCSPAEYSPRRAAPHRRARASQHRGRPPRSRARPSRRRPQPSPIAYPVSTYGQAAYRFNEHVPGQRVLLGQLRGPRTTRTGSSSSARGQPASGAWVKDLAFTLRVDVNAHWLVKAEFHRFDGTYNLSPVENPKPPGEGLDALRGQDDLPLLALRSARRRSP